MILSNAIVRGEEHLDPRNYHHHIFEWFIEEVQKATHLNPAEHFQDCKESIEVIDAQKTAKVVPHIVAHGQNCQHRF